MVWADDSLSLIDRSRNCACDCKTIQHKHSLIRICSKEARTQTSSPTSPLSPLVDSFCGQTSVASGNQLYQTTSAPGIQRCSSPSSAFPEEKVAYTPWDSTTRGVPISDLCPSYLPVSPHFSVEEELIQPDTAPPLNRSSLGTSKPFHQRCRGLLRRLKEKTRPPFRIPHGRHRSTSHPPAEMDGQESSIQELPGSYDHGGSYPNQFTGQRASQPFGCVYAADLLGIGSSFTAELPAEQNTVQFGNFNNTRVLDDAGGLFLGGANDFPSSAGPYELPVPPNQDGTLTVPTENIQPQLNFGTPAQTLDFSQPNAVSNPTHLFTRGNGPRSLNPPTLTLQTENIQGRNISYPSSRRLSWQSSISSSVHSQLTGTTPSSGTHFTPFSSTQSPFGPSSSFPPQSGLDPLRAYLDYSKNARSPVEAMPYQNHVVTPESATMRDFRGLEGFFADSHPIPSPTINDNIQFAPNRSPFGQSTQADPLGLVLQPHNHRRVSQPSAPPALPTQPQPPLSQHQRPSDQPSAPPPRVPPQICSPRPQASCDNRCPRCNHLFTSKPRDVSRNIRRHLLLSCPQRDAFVPRLSCSVLGCRKTFVRDCAKKVHEEKQHGILRGGRRGRGVAEGLPMRRAHSAV